MANKKKIATSVAAVATAAAVLLGGTFAWQSISQTALNEASDVINPGGRLHNDMWYVDAKTTNSDVYVENFAEDDIYARVRLSEYMEIVMNYGTAAEKVETVTSTPKTLKDGATVDPDNNPTGANLYDYTYDIHYFGETYDDEGNLVDTNATDTYWEWTMGSEDSDTVYYMPTFNRNKDSFAPDLNGLYRDRVGGISDREAAQYVDVDGNTVAQGYAVGDTATGYEIYDADTNDVDEIGTDPTELNDIIVNGNNPDDTAITLVADQTHTAATVGQTKGLISMSDWLDMLWDEDAGEYVYDEAEHGAYWVYDTDGWVYWTGAIGAGETTGLLLDSFTLKEVMDDSWYYAIEVEGQFVTADDLGDGSEENPGFRADGLTDNALTMLALIGVDVSDESDTPDDGGEGETTDDFANGFRIYNPADDDGTNYNNGDTVSISAAGTYTMFVSSGEAGKYDGANPDSFTWEVTPAGLTVTPKEASDDGDGGTYVSATFALDSTVPANTYTITATNETDGITRTAIIEWAGSEPEVPEEPALTESEFTVVQNGTLDLTTAWDGTTDAVITMTADGTGEAPPAMSACKVQFYVDGTWVDGTEGTDYDATDADTMKIYANGQHIGKATQAKVVYTSMDMTMYTITLPADSSGVFS